MSWAVLLSRLPVGSSARMTEGLPHQRPRNRHTLALAAGEVGGAMVRALGQADLFEHAQGLLHRLVA